MSRKRKPFKDGGARFVRLPEWLQASEAWATLKPGPPALYIEIKRRYNGRNNGEIRLSHRDAAKLICVGRNTVGPYFEELEERGLIRKERGHYLGPSGVGQTALWSLEEEYKNTTGEPAGKAFMTWRKQ